MATVDPSDLLHLEADFVLCQAEFLRDMSQDIHAAASLLGCRAYDVEAGAMALRKMTWESNTTGRTQFHNHEAQLRAADLVREGGQMMDLARHVRTSLKALVELVCYGRDMTSIQIDSLSNTREKAEATKHPENITDLDNTTLTTSDLSSPESSSHPSLFSPTTFSPVNSSSSVSTPVNSPVSHSSVGSLVDTASSPKVEGHSLVPKSVVQQHKVRFAASPIFIPRSRSPEVPQRRQRKVTKRTKATETAKALKLSQLDLSRVDLSQLKFSNVQLPKPDHCNQCEGTAEKEDDWLAWIPLKVAVGHGTADKCLASAMTGERARTIQERAC